jgi:uncharacterized protein (DUF2252 family)
VRRLDKHELPARKAFASYVKTLQEDRRVLLRRYALQDVAFKVVGVGSVGTFGAIGLLASGGGAPLLLQIKEAQQSVLAPFARASDYSNQGQRVVVGQRMLQAATDVFLGWTQTPIEHRRFYIRRLKDSRLAHIGARLEAALLFYAALCGRTLARAHARAGDAVVIRRVYRKWHSVRRRDWRLRVRLCRPDGTRLGPWPRSRTDKSLPGSSSCRGRTRSWLRRHCYRTARQRCPH